MRRSRRRESVHRIHDLERISILGKNRLSFRLQLLWEVYTGLPRSTLQPRYWSYLPWVGSTEQSLKHHRIVTYQSILDNWSPLLYNNRTLLAHPSLIENCAGRVKSHDPIHNNGIYMEESARWDNGIRMMQSARWNPHDGTHSMKCTEDHDARFIQEGIHTPDLWSWAHKMQWYFR